MEKTKMAFHEIGNGKLFLDMQRAFESAQTMAFESGQQTTVTMKITIDPPEGNKRYGSLGYEVYQSFPKKKSMKFTTELQNGLILGTGSDITDVLQEELKFADQSTIYKLEETNERQTN